MSDLLYSLGYDVYYHNPSETIGIFTNDQQNAQWYYSIQNAQWYYSIKSRVGIMCGHK